MNRTPITFETVIWLAIALGIWLIWLFGVDVVGN